MKQTGRYISYNIVSGKEHCDVVGSTKGIAIYAPIINFDSEISPLETRSENHADQFHPIKIRDIGSLARLTYDSEFPDEQDLTLFTFEHKKSWVIGYITSLNMDEIIYQFNYIELKSEPAKPFIKYRGNKGQDPEFADTFEHGFSYLPIITIKYNPTIFGIN